MMAPSKIQEEFFMDVQTIFKRYELKYLLTKEQKDRLLEKLQENLVPDPHG